MFHLTQKITKGWWATVPIAAVVISLLSALFFFSPAANAADLKPKGGGCVAIGVSTGLASPYSKTEGMCLGDEAPRRFYQFAVKLEKAVADVTVTAKSGSGTSISFVKQSDTLYVSAPDSNSLGYAAFVLGASPPCNTKDPNNIITITTKGAGSNNTDITEINLCSYKGDSSQSLIHYTASKIKDSSGAATSSTGTIRGNLGIERSDTLVPDNYKKDTLDKDYVSSFELTGPTNIKGDNRTAGYSLSNGKLEIPNLKPGSYTLKIVYNDKAAINADGGAAEWSSSGVVYEFSEILVKASKDTWLQGSSATGVYYVKADSLGVVDNEHEVSDDRSSCVIEGVGWIVCPVVNFLAGIADGAFGFLADVFLRTDPAAFNTGSTTYKAWAIMRNIANILFVIAFLVIIFSQLTNMGISNYGVKKMLPRLAIAAILVNVSFFISQIAVDLSNILGYSIRELFNGISNQVVAETYVADASTNFFGAGNSFSDIAVGILAFAAGGVLLYALLSTFLPILLAAVVALVMILFILVARQALIILLVIVSPIAFVALLLPNTEKLFKLWRKMFVALLLVFPLVALLFGASTLASTVLQGTFTGTFSGDDSNWFGQIIASAVLVLPLFLLPTLLKKSLDGIPMIGQMANKWSSKANGALSNKTKESYRGSLVGRGRAIRKSARENYRTRKFAERISRGGFMGKTNQVMASGLPILAADRYANKALSRSAEEVSNEALAKDVNAAGKSMEGQITKASARDVAHGRGATSIDGKRNFKSGDVATQMAGIDKVVASNDIAGMNELWEASQSWAGPDADRLRTHLANRIQSSSNKPAYFGAGALEMLRTNQHADPVNNLQSADQLMTTAVAGDAYSPERISKTDKDELAAVHHATERRATRDAAFAVSHGMKLTNSANAALIDPQLARSIDKNLAVVRGIARLPGSTPPPTIT